MSGQENKFVVIVGPCSADDENAVCDYINRLAKVNEKVKDKLFIIPRIYTTLAIFLSSFKGKTTFYFSFVNWGI